MNEIEKQLEQQYGKDFVEWIKHDLFKKMDKSKSKKGKGMGHLQNKHTDMTNELKEITDRLKTIPMTGENDPARRRLEKRVFDLQTAIENNKGEYFSHKRDYANIKKRQRELYARKRELYDMLRSGEGTEEERNAMAREKYQVEREMKELEENRKLVGAGKDDLVLDWSKGEKKDKKGIDADDDIWRKKLKPMVIKQVKKMISKPSFREKKYHSFRAFENVVVDLTKKELSKLDTKKGFIGTRFDRDDAVYGIVQDDMRDFLVEQFDKFFNDADADAVEGGRSAGAIVRAIMGKNKKAFKINKMKTITKASIKDAKPKQAQSIIRKVIEKRGQTYDKRGLTDNPMYNTSYSTLRRKELEGSKEKQGRLDKAKNYKFKKGLVKKDVASFSKYSIKELKQLAKNMKVKGITGKKKHELVEMVREAYNKQLQEEETEGGAFGDALFKAFRF